MIIDTASRPRYSHSMDINLDTPIQFLKGVGPHYAKIFEKRGMFKISQLLEWYPRAYEDRRAARNIRSLGENEVVSLKAQIVYVKPIVLGRTRRKIYDILIKDSSGQIHCKYFRTPFRGYFDRLESGKTVRVVGKVIRYRGSLEFHHPDIKDATEEEITDQLVPIYTETEGLTPQRLHKIIDIAIKGVYPKLTENIPQWILEKYKLPQRKDTFRFIHQPPKEAGSEYSEHQSPYHRRIIFEEFFWFQLYLALVDKGKIKETSFAMKELSNFEIETKKFLPFELTNAQKRALTDIIQDLKIPHPMRRLVQGDVGCGKTMVALLSAYYVIRNSYQVALMVPTEILADQHFLNSKKLFEPLGIKVEILKGSQTQKTRDQIAERLKNGEIDLLVGTHALIQDDVEFKNLALAIVDEQHRFGVHQRQKLKQKGVCPHFLLMTATPIPRTLALTVYGDLQCSIINELPKGRSPVSTFVRFENKRPRVYEFLKDQIHAGRQAYVVFPLVEESEKIDLKDATQGFEALTAQFPDFKIGLLHGKMKAQEKDAIMDQFRKNEIQILVSTTVIEVGVDVPNANIMLIEHAERFGLSQLHQLRGRVGRGAHKSYCILMPGYAVSEEAKERLELMEQTSDGFKVAEKDLEMRGPGEFMGTRQSGMPGFKMGNLVRDLNILMEAREAAFQVVASDPTLSKKENVLLRENLKRVMGPEALVTVG